MGNKVGNKMKQANTIKDTVCVTTGRQLINTKETRWETDKVGDKWETQCKTQWETSLETIWRQGGK